MKFNSLTFVLFFIIVIVLYYSFQSWRHRKLLLLVSSYIFYSAWNPFFVVLLWISTITDWILGQKIYQSSSNSTRIRLLILSLVINLGLLGYFKYSSFLLSTFSYVLNLYAITYNPPAWDIILPIGISFYTFQTLSYTIDIYRNKLKPSRSLLDYSLYVTFFPQLVAGPIVRASDFLPQCASPKSLNIGQLGWGLFLLTCGIFSKVVLADGILAPVVDKVFANAHQMGTFESWLAILAFSGQIFFDFSGYSTCAIGAALCLGFALPDNFLSPYAATGFSDFWQRWHISLSSWIRDYLYIPLGGNRISHLRTLLNLCVVMFLGGLWHGASWLFVLWGLLHGCFLVIEHMVRTVGGRFAPASNSLFHLGVRLVTFMAVSLSWVLFRSPDMNTATALYQHLFSVTETKIYLGNEAASVLLLMISLVAWHHVTVSQRLGDILAGLSWWGRASILGTLLSIIAFSTVDDRAFIYFQF